jgi:hypothetical protein
MSDASDINGPLADLEADANVARPIVAGGTGATTASAARTALGLAIGTDVQAYDAGLASIAGLTTAADKMIYTTAADTYAVASLTAAARGLLDDATVADMRATLAVGDNVNNTSTIQTADANNCTASGFYRLQSSCANLPEAGFFEMLVLAPNGTEIAQIAAKTTGASTWRRVRTGGSWTAWVQMTDSGNIASMLNASGSAPIYAPRAWVTFNASTGTPTILASGNVSSITDNGVGDFKINFTTAMADANFAVCGASSEGVAGSHTGWDVTARLAGSVTITVGVGTTEYDTDYVSVIVLR